MNNIAVGIVQAVCYLSFVGLIVTAIFWLLDNSWNARADVRPDTRAYQIREHFKAKAEAEKNKQPQSIWKWVGMAAVLLFMLIRMFS
jgi:hypothetical protein